MVLVFGRICQTKCTDSEVLVCFHFGGMCPPSDGHVRLSSAVDVSILRFTSANRNWILIPDLLEVLCFEVLGWWFLDLESI
jgi:hypothetical protein